MCGEMYFGYGFYFGLNIHSYISLLMENIFTHRLNGLLQPEDLLLEQM